MFRAQQNAFDDVVAKATDENLTSENWEYIMDVCDKVTNEETGAKDVVASLIKRLAHRNANVQLYTLELANALSQNCGPKMYRELSSRAFTDALLRLASDRSTHTQVKAKILERMGEWTEMFASNRDLGIMEQQYMKLRSQNPNLHPPSKPHKREITDLDRQKEEEELQMALALSIKDKSTAGPSSSLRPGQLQGGSAGGSSQAAAMTPPQPLPSGTTAATVSRVRALYDFQPSEPGELQFRKGDIIAVLESVYKDWWKGSLRGQTGIFPLNYVEKLSDPTPEEMQREAQMEAEVFGEIKNVEKLLTLLSTSSSELNIQENDEITTLYHSTLAIRPKLIELIGKYSQKKDDFTQLNEKFIKARRDYENLLEASMSQPSQPQYGRPGLGAYGYSGVGPQGYPSQGPQGDTQRYYTPGPQDHQPVPAASPAPFYFAGQNGLGSASQSELPLGGGGGGRGRTTSSNMNAPQQRPYSVFEAAQELESTTLDPSSQAPPPQKQYRLSQQPPTEYPTASSNPAYQQRQPSPSQPVYAAYPQPAAAAAAASAPNYPPPGPPHHPISSAPGSPPLGPPAGAAATTANTPSSNYPILNPSQLAPTSEGRYQAYGHQQQHGPGQGGMAGGEGGGGGVARPVDPTDYYRVSQVPSVASNITTSEMFLPR